MDVVQYVSSDLPSKCCYIIFVVIFVFLFTYN